ncbi:hypothetical protein ACQJBY_032244 [Aegilops geniculata]
MLDWWCSPSSSAVWTAWPRALGAGRTLLFFSSSPLVRSGPWRPLVAGSTVDGAAGGVVADQEKSLLDSRPRRRRHLLVPSSSLEALSSAMAWTG